MARGVYSVHADAQTISTAITILEVTAPSTAGLELMRAWVQQSNNITSAMVRIQILRKSATITGTASPPSPNGHGAEATSGVTVKWKATAEGTDGAVVIEEAFNLLNGYLWVPTPREYITVPPSGIIALKFPAAPASSAWTFGMTWFENG